MRQRAQGAVSAYAPGRRMLVILGAAALALVVALPTMVLAHTDSEHPTETTLACGEDSVLHGAEVECTVTVVDLEADEAEVANPAGDVAISSDLDDDLGSCTLEPVDGTDDASSCTVTVTLDGNAGAHELVASYDGHTDEVHAWGGSESQAVSLTVTGGTIVIQKVTETGTGTFDFTGDLGAFTLETLSEDEVVSESFADLTPGEYSITEDETPGWQLQDISCTGGDESQVTIGDGNGESGATTVTVDIVAGETVTCTFANDNLGTVTIIKLTDGDDGTFDFQTNLPGGDFSLTTVDGAAEHSVATASASDNYFVMEDDADGWELSDISCDATDGTHNIDEENRLVELSVSAGGSVVCTFSNVAADVEAEAAEELADNGCPAAPAIASAYLRELEERAGGPGFPNIISLVAREMEPEARFEGLDKCDEGYADAVEEFVDEQLDEREDMEIEHPGWGNLEREDRGGGPPPWAGGPNR